VKKSISTNNAGWTRFARGVVYLVGIAALAVCFILLPELVREESVGKPTDPSLTFLFFAFAYVLAVPFFIALYQTHKLLDLIDKHQAFTQKTLRALQYIKNCTIAFGVMLVMALVIVLSIVRSIDPREDITAFISIGFIFTFVTAIIAVFVAVLQKLVADAVALKSENDLII
jgi:hypothetical protein